MPHECKNVRGFLEKVVKGDETQKRVVKIIENKVGNKIVTKFKVKTKSGGLFTLVVHDKDKAHKLENAFPAQVEKVNIKRLTASGKVKKSSK